MGPSGTSCVERTPSGPPVFSLLVPCLSTKDCFCNLTELPIVFGAERIPFDKQKRNERRTNDAETRKNVECVGLGTQRWWWVIRRSKEGISHDVYPFLWCALKRTRQEKRKRQGRKKLCKRGNFAALIMAETTIGAEDDLPRRLAMAVVAMLAIV